MKYARELSSDITFWNGIKPLPKEINVIHNLPAMAEFELLSIICVLHGYVTAFDIISGADAGTEKDNDIATVLLAFQLYIYPKMPLSNYSSNDKRRVTAAERKPVPIASDSMQ